MSVPGERQQQQNEDNGLTEEERLQQRIDAGIQEIIGNDDGKPSLEDFLNDPVLQEKFADEEVQRIFNEIEEDPARIADHKDNNKVKEVLKRICDIFEPYVSQQNQQNPQPENNMQNMAGGQVNPELIAQQLMGGGNQNPFAHYYQGGEQNGNPFADFSQLMQGQEQNPMANLAQLFGGQGGNPMEYLSQLFQGQGGNPMENLGQLYQGQGGNPMENLGQLYQGQGGNPMENLGQLFQGQGPNPMENLGQLFQGQGGNPMENLGQLFQGQGQNPMANFANLFGGQGQGDAQINEQQLAYLQEYMRNMT
ncbi:hypothetical protein CHS0354_040096 [Potamilus streckersoni]|uniref:Uncharacterized protein n=1 Tax=Potamilus streckersoni TaxID=2493646 RepID=A0AAE0W2C2_9BIVA|nr:hypothetical protein CHS0354_040096 [Potamilus streckersoni]